VRKKVEDKKMSREKQIEEIANVIYDDPNDYDTYWRSHCEQLAETIYNAGYRKQREGKWIARKDEGLFGKEYYECSNCHSRNPTIKYNYCKNCGAKMKGGA
jgi:hypothetical protein